MRLQSLKKRYMNLPIRRKIQLSLLSIAVFAIGMGGVMHYSSMYREYMNTANVEAASTVATVSSALRDNFSAMFFNIFRFLDTDEANAVFAAAANSGKATSNTMADLYSGMDALVRSNNLIDTVLLISAGGEYFSSKTIRLKAENASIALWPDHGGARVTWLSARKTPYIVPDKYVLPLTFSLSQRKGVDVVIPKLVENGENLSFRLAIFLDYEKIKNLLQVSDQDEVGTTYIADAQMMPLSLSNQAYFSKVAGEEEFAAACLAADKTSEIRYGKETYIIHKADIGISGMHVVHLTHKRMLLSGLAAIRQDVVLAALITGVVAILLSSSLAHITTRPINKLVAYVRGSGPSGRQSAPFITQYNDEIGVLGTAIDSMLSTISQQVDTIKEEERRRADAEIRVLTQQINPHFIYNTLDCIRWEILSSNIDGSTHMVEALAKFLRLGFGRIGDTVTVAEEFLRAEQYIRIMQYRLHGKIQFTSYIQQELNDWRIPKMILQPMVENCIKHGFKNLLDPLPVGQPEVYIEAKREAGEVRIGVEDNGTGIDMEKARAVLSPSGPHEQKDSVGLYNSYLRLCRYFGADRVTVHFSTTPYFVNRVAYHIRLEPPEAEK